MNIIIEGTRGEARKQLRRVERMFDGSIMYVGLGSRSENRETYLVQRVEKDHPMPRAIMKFQPEDELVQEKLK